MGVIDTDELLAFFSQLPESRYKSALGTVGRGIFKYNAALL
jgi:hypothetical protein